MPQDLFGHEGGLAEKREGQQHEAGERHQFELDQDDEDLHGDDEEGEDDDQPGHEQNQNLREVGEQADRPHQVLGRVEQRRSGVEAGRRDAARLHELREAEGITTRLEPQPREALEHDGRKRLEIADDESEGADVERLLHEALDHILVGAPGPEQGGDRHVDRNERRGQETDLAAEQAEA